MKNKEQTLSDRIIDPTAILYIGKENPRLFRLYLKVEDVKNFIKKLKEEIDTQRSVDYILNRIDELAGEGMIR